MVWTAPAPASCWIERCAKMVVVEQPSEGAPSMGKSITDLSSVTTVGLDLAKHVFQVHAIDALRNFLRKRHKAPGRGTKRFSREHVYEELGVLRLYRVRHVSPPCAFGQSGGMAWPTGHQAHRATHGHPWPPFYSQVAHCYALVKNLHAWTAQGLPAAFP